MMSAAPRWRAPAPRVKVAAALLYRQVVRKDAQKEMSRNDPEITESVFQQHLDLLRESRCTVSTIRDLTQANQQRFRPAAAGRAVVLTFDGSYASHVDPVLPMLWERRLPGEFFINPAVIGRRDRLSWSELRGMASAGMSIQSQAFSECRLDRLNEKELFDQLTRSKGMIEDRTGYRVTVLAAPYGEVDSRIAVRARELGYRVVCACTPGYWHPGQEEIIVPRLPVRATTSNATLSAWLDNSQLAVTTERIRQFAQRLFQPTWPVVDDNNKQRKQGEV